MKRLIPVLALLVLPLAGCRREVVDYDTSFTLTPSAEPTNVITVPAFKSEQTLKAAASADEPVSAAIGLKKDEEAIKAELLSHKWSDKVLAKQLKEKQISLEAKIPANQSSVFVVTVESNKGTKVKAKVTN